MMRPPLSARRTRTLPARMEPGNGSRICSVAVERGRGWFTAGAAAGFPTMPQPATTTRTNPITAATAGRDAAGLSLGNALPAVISIKFHDQRLESLRVLV